MIINTDEDLSNFGYIPNSCPNAENITKKIINIPGNLSIKQNEQLIKKLKRIINEI